MLKAKTQTMILILLLGVIMVAPTTLPAVTAAQPDDNHISTAEATAYFHAYMTGGYQVFVHGNNHAFESYPFRFSYDRLYQALILPFGPYLGFEQQYCVLDAHFIQFAIALPTTDMQEAKAWFAVEYNAFTLIHPDGTVEPLTITHTPIRKVWMPDGIRRIRTNIGVLFKAGELPVGTYHLIWECSHDGVPYPWSGIVTVFHVLECSDYH